MADKTIYMDHAATTPVRPEVLQAMIPYFTEQFGNASSIYRLGRENRKAVDAARADIAGALHAEPTEIFFTASGSEADNWAIKGAARAAKGRHLITSSIEHPAVLNVFEFLGKNGFEVTYLPVDSEGIVHPDALKAAMRADTILVSVMMANNEIGTIQPIAELAAIARDGGALFHTDAVQAAGNIVVDVKALGSASAVTRSTDPRALAPSTSARASRSNRSSMAAIRNAANGPARRMCRASWGWPRPSSSPPNNSTPMRRSFWPCASVCSPASWNAFRM